MNWYAQVLQIAQKDFRQTRWMFALFLLGTVIATWGVTSGTSFGPYSPSPNHVVLGMRSTFSAFLPILLVLLHSGVTAMIVQADSPSRKNAFWATRPLSSSALIAAKIFLVTLGLTAVSLTGVVIALAAMGLEGSAIARVVSIAGYSALQLTLAIILIAAVTYDFRAFLVGAVAIVAVIVLGSIVWSDFVVADSNTVQIFLSIPLTVGAFAFLGWTYYQRDQNQRVNFAGFALAAMLLLSATTLPGVINAPMPQIAKIDPITTLRVGPLQFARHDDANVRLGVALGIEEATDSSRVEFAPDLFLLTAPGQSALTVELPAEATRPAIIFSGAMPWVGRPVRWLGTNTETAGTSALWGERTFAATDTLQSARMASRVRGTLTLSRPRLVASLPLQENAHVTVDGFRVNIYGGLQHDSLARVWIQVTNVNQAERLAHAPSTYNNVNYLQFALVNDRRGEAIQLTSANTSGSGGSVVVPQVSVNSTFAQFTSAFTSHQGNSIPQDEGWYRDARLVVMEWVAVGRWSVDESGSGQ